jgi:hypothetical protein
VLSVAIPRAVLLSGRQRKKALPDASSRAFEIASVLFTSVHAHGSTGPLVQEMMVPVMMLGREH